MKGELERNYNTSTTTILNKAGVPLEEIKEIDPSKFNPGIGKTTPWTKKEQEVAKQKIEEKDKDKQRRERIQHIKKPWQKHLL